MNQAAPDGERVRLDTIRRNMAFAFLAQVTGAAFTAGLTVFLARELGTRGFGVLSLALGIGGLVVLSSDFGISSSVARFVAEHRDDHARVAAVMADGLRLKFIGSATVTALLCALAGPIASGYGIPALIWPIRGIAIALFGLSMMQLGSVFAAQARVHLQLRTSLIESATETIATVSLVLVGGGVTGAAFGRAIGYLVGGALTIFLLARLLGTEIVPRSFRPGGETRRIAAYAGNLVVIEGAYTAFSQLDLLVIGAYLSTNAVGIFGAPLRLITFLAYPGAAVAAGVAPRLARSSSKAPDVSPFLAALRVLLIVQAIATAFVLGWSPLLVKILGGDYGESAAVLRGLAPFVFLSGFGPLVSLVANYLGEARRRVPVAIVTVIVNLTLDLLLVPKIGVIGACVGTDVAYALYAPAHLFICQRALQIDLRPAARTFVRTTLAGTAATGMLLLVGYSLANVWQIPLGAFAAVVAFAAVLWITGELTVSEARSALASLPVARRLLGTASTGSH